MAGCGVVTDLGGCWFCSAVRSSRDSIVAFETHAKHRSMKTMRHVGGDDDADLLCDRREWRG